MMIYSQDRIVILLIATVALFLCILFAFYFTKKTIFDKKSRYERLNNAYQIAKIGLWEYNLKNGHQSWSDEHYQIFEIPSPQPQDKLYQMYRDRIHPEDLPELDHLIQRAVSCGENFIYNHRIFLDGGQRIKYVRGTAHVTKDNTGNPCYISGTCQDLTDLVQLQKQNDFILHALGIGLWKFKPITQELFWDKSQYTLFDIDPKDFSGHYEAWENSLTPEAKKDAIDELTKALNGEKDFNTTFEIKTKSGAKKYIGGKAVIERQHNGAPYIMYGINWDRTAEVELERKWQLERQKSLHQARLASLGEMSAAMAHEINNPLALISGNLRLLNQKAELSQKWKPKIEVMERACGRISKIILGLKKFSRTDHDHELKKAYHYCSVAALLEEVLVFTEVNAKRHNVVISTLHSIPSDLHIFCDQTEIEQVLVNLINNAIDAIKHLPERWIKINGMKQEQNITLQIIDSGHGVSPNIEQKIFEPFFTTKEIGEGTGLGLSIAKGILEEHGGQIRLNKNEYPHTCFELIFPIQHPSSLTTGAA